MTRLIHTADWHLGARLVEQERGEEHARFLDWLIGQILLHEVDLLVVAGDIFDQANPPQSALAQYYQFLSRLTQETRCEAVIVGGNHDSASLLDAPRGLLQALRVRVIGAAPEEPKDCILAYANLVVAAVPFLRERDVRTASPGQSHEEVVTAIREGISAYYNEALEAARTVANGRPILATGHLTTVGASSSGSERDIHIGNLGAVDASCFEGFDYVALGHIHRPQIVGGSEMRRYVGSPIAFGFDEAAYGKQILLLKVPDIAGATMEIASIPIPAARELLRISCGLKDIEAQSFALDPAKLPPWVEWTITADSEQGQVEVLVKEAAQKAGVQVLKLICPRKDSAATEAFAGKELRELKPMDIFLERLKRRGTAADSEEGQELVETFQLLLSRMAETASA